MANNIRTEKNTPWNGGPQNAHAQLTWKGRGGAMTEISKPQHDSRAEQYTYMYIIYIKNYFTTKLPSRQGGKNDSQQVVMNHEQTTRNIIQTHIQYHSN